MDQKAVEPFETRARSEKHFMAGVREGLRDAVLRERRNPVQVLQEAVQLIGKPNRLTVREYFEYRTYRQNLDPDARSTYVGKDGAEDLYARTISGEHVATARDKVIFHQIMSAESKPVPRVVALYHPYRTLASATVLRSADELEDFLLSVAEYPLFSKPVRERQSLGAQAWVGADPATRTLVTGAGETVPVSEFLRAIEPFELGGYLFQELLRPDERLERVCGSAVSTVRLMVLLDDRSPHLFRASWKIPVGTNVADNLWRPGNLLGALDIETGEVRRVVRGLGAQQEQFERHPDTDQLLVGWQFPEWSRLRDLAQTCACLFPGIGIQSWDIALTDRGPTMIELNFGGDPMLVQLAHDGGIYDAQFREIVSRRHEPSDDDWWA